MFFSISPKLIVTALCEIELWQRWVFRRLCGREKGGVGMGQAHFPSLLWAFAYQGAIVSGVPGSHKAWLAGVMHSVLGMASGWTQMTWGDCLFRTLCPVPPLPPPAGCLTIWQYISSLTWRQGSHAEFTRIARIQILSSTCVPEIVLWMLNQTAEGSTQTSPYDTLDGENSYKRNGKELR